MKQFKRFAPWLLSACCLLSLLLLAAGCLGVYLGGEGFSRETVSRQFSLLWPGLLLCLLLGCAALPASITGQRPQKAADRGLYRPGRETAAGPIPGLLLGLAALFILLGVINGGARDVLIKAINICTECIGLG